MVKLDSTTLKTRKLYVMFQLSLNIPGELLQASFIL